MLSLGFGGGSGYVLQRVLCLGAHSDDIEIGCGGSVLRLAAAHPGLEVHWVVFSATPLRKAEALASASAFLARAGAAHVTVHAFRDGYFPFVGDAIKDEFEALRRQVAPELIFTHCGHDLHQDHRLLSQLTYNTFRDHLILEYEVPKWDGDLRTPNIYLPLENAVAQRKIDLLLQHFSSQAGRDWFTADTFAALMRIRGLEARAPEGKAEGFYCRKLIL
jgi:LmbE family N-acetylglucosaminyl deacetylase